MPMACSRGICAPCLLSPQQFRSRLLMLSSMEHQFPRHTPARLTQYCCANLVEYACVSWTRATRAARVTGACWHGWRRPVNWAAPPRACVRGPHASWASEGV
eukprot:6157812-Pleurochrysis_carterae.AAC.1